MGTPLKIWGKNKNNVASSYNRIKKWLFYSALTKSIAAACL